MEGEEVNEERVKFMINLKDKTVGKGFLENIFKHGGVFMIYFIIRESKH